MRARFALLLAAVVAAGCAKFPSNGQDAGTRLVFTYRIDGPVNPTYRYYLAIRLLRAGDRQDQGPIPVVGPGSKNGFVEGSPTHFIAYEPGASIETFNIYRFRSKAEAPDPTDENPINLGAPELVAQPISAVDPAVTGNDPSTFRFEVALPDLCINAARQQVVDPATIVAIQFNILTMNRAALSGGDVGSRVFDALGNTRIPSSLNAYRTLTIQTGAIYRNSDLNNAFPEPTGDVFNGDLPAIDVSDWQVEVRTE